MRNMKKVPSPSMIYPNIGNANKTLPCANSIISHGSNNAKLNIGIAKRKDVVATIPIYSKTWMIAVITTYQRTPCRKLVDLALSFMNCSPSLPAVFADA